MATSRMPVLPLPSSLMPGPAATESEWPERMSVLFWSPPLVWARTLKLWVGFQHSFFLVSIPSVRTVLRAVLPSCSVQGNARGPLLTS